MPCPEVKIERLRPAGGKTERGLSMKGWKKVTAILAAALLLASCGAALAKTEDFREADRPLPGSAVKSSTSSAFMPFSPA